MDDDVRSARRGNAVEGDFQRCLPSVSDVRRGKAALPAMCVGDPPADPLEWMPDAIGKKLSGHPGAEHYPDGLWTPSRPYDRALPPEIAAPVEVESD
jgi:hypothetical protein